MKLAVADRPEIPVQDEYDTNYREFTFGVDGPPSTGSSTTLMKVDGISSMDANHDPYSIYVSIPRGSTGGDIVSNELMMRKGWEELAVFTQIGQLDALARVSEQGRSFLCVLVFSVSLPVLKSIALFCFYGTLSRRARLLAFFEIMIFELFLVADRLSMIA